jgi:hypothetical protein
MRECTKSTLSFPWVMSLFDIEQPANILSAGLYGMVCAVQFAPEQGHCTNRFVRSSKFGAEEYR